MKNGIVQVINGVITCRGKNDCTKPGLSFLLVYILITAKPLVTVTHTPLGIRIFPPCQWNMLHKTQSGGEHTYMSDTGQSGSPYCHLLLWRLSTPMTNLRIINTKSIQIAVEHVPMPASIKNFMSHLSLGHENSHLQSGTVALVQYCSISFSLPVHRHLTLCFQLDHSWLPHSNTLFFWYLHSLSLLCVHILARSGIFFLCCITCLEQSPWQS